MTDNKHIGSNFDDFLKEECIEFDEQEFEKDINVPSKRKIMYDYNAIDCEQYSPDSVCCYCKNIACYKLEKQLEAKEQECERLSKGYAELTDIVTPYMDDFTGYNEELGGFDLILCVKELLQQLDQLKQRLRHYECDEAIIERDNYIEELLQVLEDIHDLLKEYRKSYGSNTHIERAMRICEVLDE